MNNEYLLQIKNLSKSFSGVKVLNGVEISVKPGTIHALMGENGAGKSTLMKCLFGIYKQDEGEFYLNGEKFNFTDPKHALEHGVSMVHQELNQVLQRTVVDNVWLGRYPTKGLFVDEKKMLEDTIELFKKIEVDIDPTKNLADLSVSQRQMVEIVKAVSYDAKVIVLDEPTSSLTQNEVDKLFEIMRTLKKQGIGLIYISHKMEEIFEISDYVTVLRDGNYIGTKVTKEIDIDTIIKMMVGRDLKHRFPSKSHTIGEIVLEVKNLSTTYKPRVKNVSFKLKKGEILGLSGLVGSRRTELVEAIFGARKRETGELILNGKLIKNDTTVQAISNGFALITEERRETGIYPVSNITFNSTIANVHNYKGITGLLNGKQMEKDTSKLVRQMKIKTPSNYELIRALSGGNQQKVIIGRWLLLNPDILLMDEPTRGIDVGAKFEIYQLMLDLVSQGKSIIMVSSEMPELLGITDRIGVMSNGRLAGIVDTKSTNQEELFKMTMKYL
ncbi:MAG: ATP-binding cassette domain-containing protein [Candidatus Izimaplasma sp.]|nr:ATP-binding cassette domain-containing protein [Candidatus Izimaplasma bacterium]